MPAEADAENRVAFDRGEQRRTAGEHPRLHLRQRLAGGDQDVVGVLEDAVSARTDQPADARAAPEEVLDAAVGAAGAGAAIAGVERG